jgi:hypothetical protein
MGFEKHIGFSTGRERIKRQGPTPQLYRKRHEVRTEAVKPAVGGAEWLGVFLGGIKEICFLSNVLLRLVTTPV